MMSSEEKSRWEYLVERQGIMKGKYHSAKMMLDVATHELTVMKNELSDRGILLGVREHFTADDCSMSKLINIVPRMCTTYKGKEVLVVLRFPDDSETGMSFIPRLDGTYYCLVNGNHYYEDIMDIHSLANVSIKDQLSDTNKFVVTILIDHGMEL